MKKTALALCAALVAAVLFAGLAEAKRMGGGSSFGSRSTYSRSYSKPAAPTYTQPGATRPAQQMGQPAPAQQPPVAAPQTGLGSRLGWGLGGLVAGGLIGSMLFGGHGGMGWGGGIGLMDILLIGLVIFFAVKLLRRRGAPAQSGPGAEQPAPPSDARSRAEQGWEGLRSQPDAATGSFGAGEPQAQAQPVVPQGFNTPEFLEGAKTVYARLQHSWDRRDLKDIALFTTPEVHAEITRQAQADPNPSKTEILLVNASLLEFREEAVDTVVSVLFDVLLREDAAEDRPRQVREVWHFSRPTSDTSANWRLEGIQQMES